MKFTNLHDKPQVVAGKPHRWRSGKGTAHVSQHLPHIKDRALLAPCYRQAEGRVPQILSLQHFLSEFPSRQATRFTEKLKTIVTSTQPYPQDTVPAIVISLGLPRILLRPLLR